MRCFYSPDFTLDLPANHIFPAEKFRVSQEMLLASGVLRPDEIVEVGRASLFTLGTIHSLDYIERIQCGQLDAQEQMLLGLPTMPRLFTKCATEVEATRQTCRAALADGCAVCLGGGTHHAFKRHGEIFSVFNDIAIAVRDLQRTRPGIKIMVIDTDALQGNGTNSLLANDPNVYTYSIYSNPGPVSQAVKGSMDVHLPEFVAGPSYLKALFSTLALALVQFTPDFVIWVAGADHHKDDYLGSMQLTMADIAVRDEVILNCLMTSRIPTAILYGGGYNRNPMVTAEIHSNTVAIAKRLSRTVMSN